MADNTGIEWTESTWNPTVGCTRVSPGCKYCYAAVMHARLNEMGQQKYSQPFEKVHPWEPHLFLPLKWKDPRTIFVNSMSDLFHEDLSDEYIRRVFKVMETASHHTFQVLTKRSSRLVNMADRLRWPRNVWVGVSVESSGFIGRVDDLEKVDAAVRFLSIEPLLGPIPKLPLDKIDWVIVGGESGHRARPMDEAWAASVRDQCAKNKVPFFLKQLGGRRGKRGGAEALLDGRRWQELPTINGESESEGKIESEYCASSAA